MRRFFNQRERTILYISADGRCKECGSELSDGWHADHVHPFSKGGATVTVNGQALCPNCNLKKGNTSMADQRPWQKEATGKYFEHQGRDFLAVACPGAGKTRWALSIAKELKRRGDVDQIIVVVPSDALKTQWSATTEINLRPYSGGPVRKRGYDGIVTTYQAIAQPNAQGMIGYELGRGTRTLAIFDEIHHAADTSKYGEGLAAAFENAHRRLLLTGTPWRTDGREKMPFVSFDRNNMLEVDYSYDYHQAVIDGVCRPIQFPIVNGRAEWARDGEQRSEEISVNRSLRGVEQSDVVRTLLDAGANGGWIKDVIVRANKDLQSIRTEIPDAGGLIVARDKNHAHQIADTVQRVVGVRPPVVVSGEDDGDSGDAQETIAKFRDSTSPWIVAVKMIAEGVDIPRLMVGVYATNVTTSMFFNQVVGRFVRIRPDEVISARLYVVPTPTMWSLVTEIEQMVPQELLSGETGQSEDRPPQLEVGEGDRDSTFISLGSTAGGLDRVGAGGKSIDGSSVESWERFFSQVNIPTHLASNAAQAGPAPDVAVKEREKPRHQHEKELRGEIKSLAGKVAHRRLGDYRKVGEVNRRMWRVHESGVDGLTIAQLEHYKEVLREWLTTGRNPVA